MSTHCSSSKAALPGTALLRSGNGGDRTLVDPPKLWQGGHQAPWAAAHDELQCPGSVKICQRCYFRKASSSQSSQRNLHRKSDATHYLAKGLLASLSALEQGL